METRGEPFPEIALGLGLVMLALALPSVMGGMQLAFEQLGNDLVQVIRVLGAR